MFLWMYFSQKWEPLGSFSWSTETVGFLMLWRRLKKLLRQEYPVTRTRKWMKQFQYEGNDEPLIGKGKFRNEFFSRFDWHRINNKCTWYAALPLREWLAWHLRKSRNRTSHSSDCACLCGNCWTQFRQVETFNRSSIKYERLSGLAIRLWFPLKVTRLAGLTWLTW